MNTEKSKVTGQSDGATARPERSNMQRVQNTLLIWLGNNIDDSNADCLNTITQLRRVVNDINTFTDIDSCIDFVTDICNEKVCMVISDTLYQSIIPLIHDIIQLHNIFIFCETESAQEQWIKKWPKIKGVFTEITSICEGLKQTTHQYEQNSISISFVQTSVDMSKNNLDQLDPIFMYSQILKEILLTVKFTDEHIKQYIDYCRDAFAKNDAELKKMDKLQTEYHTKTPIWWYTFESFLYPMLNRALRLMDMDIIIKMGFFIDDLHCHIQKLHFEQFISNNSKQIFTVYRGQGMSKSDFDQMRNTQGGLMSFNNFLSTSKDRQVSLQFAESNAANCDLIGILFIINIDPTKSTTPFASIVDDGYYGDQEDEVLFSMHTVFRIDEITSLDKNQRLFEIQLTLTSDNDKDLRVLTDRIREETSPSEEGWFRLGFLLCKVGEYAKAEKVYDILLGQTSGVREKGNVFLQLGQVTYHQGQYREAITFYEKALENYNKILPPIHLNFANCYVNIGAVYASISNNSKALSYYKKALEIQQQSLPSNHPDLGDSYNNIGLVYENMGDYLKALSCYEKALEIEKQSLPSNHPNLGSSYNSIGGVYFNMGAYVKALSYHEKALEIRKQSLPSNHHHLGDSYNNIGNVHFDMGDYPKALSYHEKALETRKQSLPSNHPDLGSSYNNIGLMYSDMGDYPKALSYCEKALEIQQQLLSSNHPDLGDSYNNIGNVHFNMGDYPKALSSHEKALEIKKQSLSPNHPDLGTLYNNIGNAYFNMGDYPKALSYYEKALEIRKQSLPSNHHHLGDSYNNIGNMHFEMGDLPKALSDHEKALEIRKQSLPSNHPNLGMSYNNIGSVYKTMGDYSKALLSLEKALEIQEQSLSSNHPALGMSYSNIGLVYFEMGDYPKALSSHEKALEIRKQSLPSNHPDLWDSYNNIGLVYSEMGDYPKADAFYERAVGIGRNSLPINHSHQLF